MSYVICEQQRRRSDCASVQSDQCLCCSLLRWYNISRFYSRNFKTLASVYGCTGRFVSVLYGNSRRHILSWRGSIRNPLTLRMNNSRELMDQDNLDATFDLPTSLTKGVTKESYSIASPISSQGSPSMVGSETHLVRLFSGLFHLSHIMRTPVLPYANNKGADQPAHPWSQINAFVICCLDSTIPLVSIPKFSSL